MLTGLQASKGYLNEDEKDKVILSEMTYRFNVYYNFAQPRKSYRTWLQSTHKNGCGGAISVTQLSCAPPISQVKGHITDKCSYDTGRLFLAPLQCDDNLNQTTMLLQQLYSGNSKACCLKVQAPKVRVVSTWQSSWYTFDASIHSTSTLSSLLLQRRAGKLRYDPYVRFSTLHYKRRVHEIKPFK